MTPALEPLVFFAVGAMALIVILVVLNRVFIGYRMNERSFDVLLFHCIPVVRVQYESIIAVEAVPIRRSLFHTNPFRTISAGNRVFARRYVDIRRSGWFSHVAITPPEPDALVRELKRRSAAINEA